MTPCDNTLASLWEMNHDSDCGFIMAFRENYRADQNIKRNESLYLKLMEKGYNIINMRSDFLSYYDQEIRALPKVFKNKGVDNHPKPRIQGGELVGYFVIDSRPRNDLEENLTKFAEFFEQDSILFIPQGRKASWIATNRCQENFIQPRGTKVCYNNGVIPKGGAFFTSYIDGKPLCFNKTDGVIHTIQGMGYSSRLGIHLEAKKHWSDLTPSTPVGK